MKNEPIDACRQRQIEEAAAAAVYAAAGGKERGGSASSKSGRSKPVTFGADDLLAALTWVVVQVHNSRVHGYRYQIWHVCMSSGSFLLLL